MCTRVNRRTLVTGIVQPGVSAGSSRFVNSQFCGRPYESTRSFRSTSLIVTYVRTSGDICKRLGLEKNLFSAQTRR